MRRERGGGVVYVLFDQEDGSVRYVGLTSRTAEIRFAQHISLARYGDPRPLYQWIREVGETRTRFRVVDQASTDAELREREDYWIGYYLAHDEDLTNNALPRSLTDTVPEEYELKFFKRSMLREASRVAEVPGQRELHNGRSMDVANLIGRMAASIVLVSRAARLGQKK